MLVFTNKDSPGTVLVRVSNREKLNPLVYVSAFAGVSNSTIFSKKPYDLVCEVGNPRAMEPRISVSD